MDELARLVNMDPFEFRLKNLKDARLRAVLEAAAHAFAWGRERGGDGRGFGIACGTEKGSLPGHLCGSDRRSRDRQREGEARGFGL